MTYVVAVAKIGKRADSTDPNDFIFHSSYNTFKIIKQQTIPLTLAASTNNQTFSISHGLSFIPLPDAFAKRTGSSVVFKPNAKEVENWGPKLGMVGDITFNYISADATHVHFNFDNAKATAQGISVSYFLLEKID